VGRTEINAQGQNDLCYVSESLLGKLTGGTENLPIYRGSVNDGKIVGINSLGFGLERDGSTADIDGQSNSSFGEFSADTRVSLYSHWVARTQSIQEPNQLVALISCGLLAWLSKKTNHAR